MQGLFTRRRCRSAAMIVTPPPPRTTMIDILIALEEPLLGVGVATALEQQPDLRVIASVRRAADVGEAVARHAPHVALVDTRFQRAHRDLIPELSRRHPGTRVIVMVDHSEDACILRARGAGGASWRFAPDALARLDECCFIALRSCARGCLPKGSGVDRLVASVRSVAAGEIAAGAWLTPVSSGTGTKGAADDVPAISARELEVIEGVAAGLENKEIAARLGIAERTVKNHLARITVKLGVRGRVDLAAFAIRHHIAH